MSPARTEYAMIFTGLSGPMLHRPARLASALPALVPQGLLECGFAWSSRERLLILQARVDALRAGVELVSRLRFWTAQSNAVLICMNVATPRERFLLTTSLGRCELRTAGIGPHALTAELERTLAGVVTGSELRQLSRAPLLLELVLGEAPSGVLAASNISDGGLFVATPCAPPIGDRFTLSVRVPETPSPFEVDVRVTHVRAPGQARLGEPAGFGVSFLRPTPGLLEAVRRMQASQAAAKEGAARARAAPSVESRRTHPRVPVHAPAALELQGPELRLQYDDAEGFVSDYVSNLSMGGAFVRTKSPPPLRSKVRLRLQVLDEIFAVNGEVVHVGADGIGVQFEPDEATELKLASLVMRLSNAQR